MKGAIITARLAALAALASTAGLSQTFEVASVKPAAARSGEGSRRESVEFGPDSLTLRNVRMTTCIKWAYHVFEYQVAGPAWLTSERFDVIAKSAQPVDEQQLRLMLRELLADRFKLAFHRENKEMAAYVVTVGKNGHKLQPSDGPGPVRLSGKGMGFKAEKASVEEMADLLTTPLRAPVVDETGLKGRFDFTIDVSPYISEVLAKRSEGNAIPDIIALGITAIQEQLGLKIDSRKMPVEILAIDQIVKIPTEN